MSAIGFVRKPGRWLATAALAGVVASALAAPNPVSGPKKEESSQSAAPTAILIEADSGTVLFEKNADELVAPASLAKLMTTEVVFNELKEGNLKLDEEFVVSENAWRKGGAPSGGSTMFAAAPQPREGRGPAARRDHPVRQRCLHRARRRHRRQRSGLLAADERARARTRADASRTSPIPPACRIPTCA